jgi:hypothetical protein
MKCDDARLWDVLIDASREAHARGQHAVAYHALAAAMHAADDQSNGDQLGEIEREANRQLGWIDEYAHDDRLSTRSASTRNHPGMYVLLARTASAHCQMLVRRSELEHARHALTSRFGIS